MSHPVRRNDTYMILGHLLRVTSVKGTHRAYDGQRERRVFLTCAKDCNCGLKFAGQILWPVKLKILERHLHQLRKDVS